MAMRCWLRKNTDKQNYNCGAHHGQLIMAMSKQWYNTDDVTSYGGSDEKGAKSLGPSEGDGGGAKHIEGIEAEENQAESNVW